MHSVERSPEPNFIAELRTTHSRWSKLDGPERQRIRNELSQDFGNVCAYCEQLCMGPTRDHFGTEESIDHYRPREQFPNLWLDWLNLTYACRRCNQAKDNKWPTPSDNTNQCLSGLYTQYIPVSEYVNPNAVAGQRPARDFFDFDITTGEITPSAQIEQIERSMAWRTIVDVDLNDSKLGENEPGHLWNRRRRQLIRLTKRLSQLDDFDEKVNIMREFMLPDKPFSSFINTYIMDRFPLMARVLP